MIEYIEREAILKDYQTICNGVECVRCPIRDKGHCKFEAYIRSIPAADVRPVVLCRDCIFRSNEWTGCPKLNGTITGDEFFCKCGIKKREES